MRLKFIFIISLFACSFSAVSANTEDTEKEKFYAGGILGQAQGAVGSAAMNTRMATLGYDAEAEVNHQNRTAWGLLAGYEWTPHLNVEVGYTDLGKVTTRLSGSVTDVEDYLNSANLVHPRSAEGAEFTLLGRYPVSERWQVFARGGVLFADSSYYADAQTDSARRKNSSGEFIFGFGAHYDLNERWALRASWNRYQIEDEKIKLLGLTLVYRIPHMGYH